MKNDNPLLSITAGQVMTRGVVTVPYDWSVDRLARFLTDKSISGAPVVDESGKVVGVVTLSDIVRQAGSGLMDLSRRDDAFYQTLHDASLSGEEQWAFNETIDQSVLINDIMTPVVFEVAPDTPLAKVADAMVTGRIHRVLVTENRQIEGIITALDLLKALI